MERDEAYQNGNAIYYLAQSHRRNNNMPDALIYYQKVLEKYPGTERARVAQSYVDANGGSQGQQDGNQSPQDNGQGQQDGNQSPQDNGQGQQDGQQQSQQGDGQQDNGQPEGEQ